MQAIRFHPPGAFDKLSLSEEAIPTLLADEVLVRVHATSLIWTEIFWPIYQKEDGSYFSHIPGHDFSGTISQLGSEVTPTEELYEGAEVMVFTAFSNKTVIEGGMATYAKAKSYQIVPKPRSLSLLDAASVPLSALTAWQALFVKADLKKGQTLLITGAAGPTALWAVQLGKWVGAKVIGTAGSEESFKLLKSLSIDEIVNYRTQKLSEEVRDVDLIFDTIGHETAREAARCLKQGGIFLNICDPTVKDMGDEMQINASFFIVWMDRDQLDHISKLIDEGKLKTFIDSVFEFEDFQEGFARGASRKSHGKILLKGPK